MAMTLKHFWKAEDYHQHSSVQKNAAEQLLQHIQLNGNEQILDVGCGDGKITAAIAKRVPSGRVIGIDISKEMINFACNAFLKNHYPNLTFLCQDAQQFNYCAELDIVFSSFALQWVPDPSLFFKCVNNSLKQSGYIAVTVPLGISSELEEAISTVISLSDWSPYFKEFSPKWYFMGSNKYKQLLTQHQFIPHLFDNTLQKIVFPSREKFEKYVIQWLSYLNPIPQSLKQAFFNQIINKYLEISPIHKNGEIMFSFARLDFVAKKAIP